MHFSITLCPILYLQELLPPFLVNMFLFVFQFLTSILFFSLNSPILSLQNEFKIIKIRSLVVQLLSFLNFSYIFHLIISSNEIAAATAAVPITWPRFHIFLFESFVKVTQNIFRLHKGSLDSSLDGLSDDIYFPNLVISLQISYLSSISL